MGYTLWNLLRDAYQELGQLKVAKATGGSVTMVIDSLLVNTGKDDDWNGGAVMILEDAAGTGAAPEGEFARVNDYADSTGMLTIDALTAAVASGDVYGLVSAYYPLWQMIELANQALRELGDLMLVDAVNLDTAENQTEYAAATVWKRRPPRQIDIQTRTGNANDHGWTRVYGWEFVPSEPGSSGLIVFRSLLPAGRDVRVWYQEIHPRVSAYSDAIHETIHPGLATAALVEKALTWQVSRLEGENVFMVQRLNDARNELERMKMLHPIWIPGRSAKMMLAGMGHH